MTGPRGHRAVPRGRLVGSTHDRERRAVAVVDTWNHAEITRFDARRAPHGLALSADGNTLFVQNFMDRSVTAHDVSGLRNGGVNPPTLLGNVSTVAVTLWRSSS